jgi:antitoxin Phd
LYDAIMVTFSVSDAREKLSEVIDTSRSEAVILERYGRPAAVVVSPERYQQFLDAVEEAEDVAAFDRAATERGHNIPWDQVRADLGWS